MYYYVGLQQNIKNISATNIQSVIMVVFCFEYIILYLVAFALFMYFLMCRYIHGRLQLMHKNKISGKFSSLICM